jgi:hypothetical protein
MEITSYITHKLTAALGGLVGGASIMSYIRPHSIGEAFARGGTSTGAAIIFAGPLLVALRLPTGWEMQLVSGFVIGFIAYSVLGAVANFLDRHKERDIVDLVKAARGDIEPETKPEPPKERVKRRKKA